MADRRRRSLRSRATLGWGLACFALFQVALSVALEQWWPVLRDPEFAYKTALLKARRAAEPGRGLFVVLGSSRAGLGFRPDVLAVSAESPIVFNYAFTGGGPLLEIVCLDRLIRAGIRPDWLIVEIHPALLHQNPRFSEEVWTNAVRLSWQDLRILRRHSAKPADQLKRWVESRLVPASAHRFAIMSRLAPHWLPWGDNRQDIWLQMDAHGWLPYGKPTVSEAEYRKGVAFAHQQYGHCFDGYCISPHPDRALRELLGTCRQCDIRVLLLTMPEGPEFQSWFSAAARRTIHAYLTKLRREFDAPWIDARDWVSRDCLFDDHHLLGSGAAVFTERFGRDVLLPLLEHRPIPAVDPHSSETYP